MAIADSICWTLGNGQTASRLTSFNGQSYGYGDSGPFHAVDRIGGSDRFDYNANGNMVKRNKGLAGQQSFVWDAQNRLSQVQDNNGNLVERYWYGGEGMRVKKMSGTTTTYTFFAHYEEEVTGVVTTTVSHYSFGGLRIAVKRGSDFYHLQGDHLGSNSLTTDGAGAAIATRADYAYGAERSSSGDLQTDRTFTGQESDASGLMYYNARYYDPALGTFVSPDSMVPEPGMVFDYNRLLYAWGNPFNNADPSGHCPSPAASNQYASRNIICVAGFIPTARSTGVGVWFLKAVDFKGDSRAFSSNSQDASRFAVWIDADTGEILQQFGQGTQHVNPFTGKEYGPLYLEARGPHGGPMGYIKNWYQGFTTITTSMDDDGSITLNYRVVCSSWLCGFPFDVDGEMTFTPNEFGSFDVQGKVDAFPNLEGYHHNNGRAPRTLFQIQNYGDDELENDRGDFWTAMGMNRFIRFRAIQEDPGEDNTLNFYMRHGQGPGKDVIIPH